MGSTSVVLIKDYLRINGLDGQFIESVSDSSMYRFEEEISLQSGVNQYSSLQIAVTPLNGSVLNAEVSFSDLTSENGNIIDKSGYSLFIEWFHRLNLKLVPDLLIPLDENNSFKIPQDESYLSDQRAGAIWVDLWIPVNTPAGNYDGTIEVLVDSEVNRFKISCKVFELAVPNKGRITADLNNYADSISLSFDSLKNNENRYDDNSYNILEAKFYKMSRDHHCLFHNLPYRHSGNAPKNFLPELEGEGKYIHVKSWQLFDEHFEPYLSGTAFNGSNFGSHPVEFMYLPFHLGWPANYEKWGKKGYRTEYRRILQEFVRHFEEKGWDKTVLEILLNHKKDYRFYPYTVDEIWYEHDQDVVDTYYDIIKDIYESSSAHFVFRMDSSNHYGNHFNHRFSDMCKMWVAGFAMFNWFPESVEVMREKGNILWIYGSVLQSLDESLLSMLVWPIQCMMTGTTGFTVWNTTGFGVNPLECPVACGGEALFYPGSYFGIEAPLPSIRLKSLRNAMQLTELAMTAQGSPLQKDIESCINKAFGLNDNSEWFREKPDFVNTPPRYWDFDNEIGKLCLPPMYKNRTVNFSQKLAEEIYSILDGDNQNKKSGVAFKFQ